MRGEADKSTRNRAEGDWRGRGKSVEERGNASASRSGGERVEKGGCGQKCKNKEEREGITERKTENLGGNSWLRRNE